MVAYSSRIDSGYRHGRIWLDPLVATALPNCDLSTAAKGSVGIYNQLV